MKVLQSQVVVKGYDYARTNAWFAPIPQKRRMDLAAAVTQALDDDLAENENTKPDAQRIREIKKRVRKELTDQEPKGFLPIIFAALLGFLVTKLLDYLWDNFVNQNATAKARGD
jgi:hypothetical protein